MEQTWKLHECARMARRRCFSDCGRIVEYITGEISSDLCCASWCDIEKRVLFLLNSDYKYVYQPITSLLPLLKNILGK